MRAVYYDSNGSAADVLRVAEVDTPRPAAGEVLVAIHASGVNPSDVKTRLGSTRKMAFPRVIPHSDGAGIIEAVGAGVAGSRIGERVWLWNGQWKRPFGTACEFVALPEQQAVPLHESLSFEQGACLGIPAMTACHAVDLAGARADSTVLIAGGAGAVGHYAIQFAKANGARVIATVSSEEKGRLASAAGADSVIDYKRENVGSRVAELTAGKGVDSIIEVDLPANAALIPHVLAPKGTVVVYGVGGPEAKIPAFFCLTNSISMRFLLVYELDAETRRQAVGRINALIAAKRLTHNVGRVLPLADAVAAHEAVERGAIGNVVLKVR